MAWAVTADPNKFDKAVAWFRKRVPVTENGYRALTVRERDRAFHIAHVQQMRVVETIYNEIDRAIAEGTPFGDFKKRIRDKLKAHEVGGAHLETVFRNAVQSAYNAGRWYQLTEVSATRPYWVLDVVLDDRTSDKCKPVDGVCKAHDDPWWLTNWPPRHHRCRTGVRSVRASEAKRIGITKGTPEPTPDAGFGYAPPLVEVDDDTELLFNVPEPVKRVYKRRRARNKPR